MQLIINAGGTGTRLWPLSTASKPKQFVPLLDEESFLTKTYRRLESAFEREKIWINTNQKFSPLVQNVLPQALQTQVLLEPQKRDNFAAILSHAALIARRTSRTEPLIFLASDHLIGETDWPVFNQSLNKMAAAVTNKEFDLVIAGVRPSFASTQLGYIEVDPKDKEDLFGQVVPLKMFKEKPHSDLAEQFISSGNFLWNLGYFAFTFETLLENLAQFWPNLVSLVEQIYQTGEITTEIYEQFPKTSIDYALVEKMDQVGVLGMDIAWEDIGSWQVAAQYLPPLNQNGQIQVEGNGNKIYGLKGKKVAFVGVSNVMLVETEDGLLVLNLDKSGEVKKAAEHFEQK